MQRDFKVPLINRIEAIARDIPGWSPVEQLYTLFNFVCLTTPLEGDIVEVGAWCGRSSVVLGMAAQIAGGTCVHSIDLFPDKEDWKQNEEGNYWIQVQVGDTMHVGCREQPVWKEPFEKDILPLYAKHECLLSVFNETISKYGLNDWVIAHRGDSTDFAHSVSRDFKCRLAFIDGDHSYEAVCRDIGALESHIVAGGWICFDDAFTHYTGINRAIEEKIIGNPAYGVCQQMTRKLFVAQKRIALR